MTMTGVAALIAAVSFAVLACCAVYLTMRLTRVVDDAATLVREARTDQQVLLARANAAVDRASTRHDRAGRPGVRAGRLRPHPRGHGGRRPGRPGRRGQLRRMARCRAAPRRAAACTPGR